MNTKRQELLDEKAENMARLTEINALLEGDTLSVAERRRLNTERAEILGDNVGIDNDLRHLNDRKAHPGAVTQLVCAAVQTERFSRADDATLLSWAVSMARKIDRACNDA